MFPSQRGSNDLGAATLPYFDLATYTAKRGRVKQRANVPLVRITRACLQYLAGQSMEQPSLVDDGASVLLG